MSQKHTVITDLRAKSLKELQEKLIEIIVSRRLYRDEDLRKIFDEAVQQNAYTLGDKQIRDLCNSVL